MHPSLTSALYRGHWSMYDKYEALEAKSSKVLEITLQRLAKVSATTEQNAGWTPSQCGRCRE
jgi:hypothetical protein